MERIITMIVIHQHTYGDRNKGRRCTSFMTSVVILQTHLFIVQECFHTHTVLKNEAHCVPSLSQGSTFLVTFGRGILFIIKIIHLICV